MLLIRLFLAFSLVVLITSCGRSGCGPEEGMYSLERSTKANSVEIIFDQKVADNPNFKLLRLEPFEEPNLGYEYKQVNLQYSTSYNRDGFFLPIPTDKEKYGFIINYKDSISDTLVFNIKVQIINSEKNVCFDQYFYQRIEPFNVVFTSNYLKYALVNVAE